MYHKHQVSSEDSYDNIYSYFAEINCIHISKYVDMSSLA